MPGPLPEGYRRLGRFAVRVAAGKTLYDQGAVPEACIVILAGRVNFEIVDDDGQPAVVASAEPGDLVGHVAHFTGRPTSAAARAESDCVVLSIPRPQLPEAFREAPELALQLILTFADPERAAPARTRTAPPVAPTAPAEGASADDGVIRIREPYDEAFFFLDSAACPISGTRFEFLRVRSRSVRPAARDSDFFVKYTSMDPTYYSLVVCPTCGYTAYHDDFAEIDADESARLTKDRPAREALAAGNLCGTRDMEAAQVALDLALHCYALRATNERRRAVLLHRRAWIERQRGDAQAELDWLRQARDAYQKAYESDKDITDESAMRAAYLIGDLMLRLGDVAGGARWLETATRSPEAKTQSGLARMARDRLHDARMLLQKAS